MKIKWLQICQIDVLQPERGVAALIDGLQIAIFRTHDNTLYAISNRDPIAKAQVMSRGIVGTRGSAPTVASPLHKQVYDLRTGECLDLPGIRIPTYPDDLRTGECLDLPGIRIPTYPVRCIDGHVEISVV